MTGHPRYSVLEKTFLKPVGHLSATMLEPGAEIEFEGRPGMSLRPLNASARAAKLESIHREYRSTSFQDHSMLFRLARSLGAPDGGSWTAARAFIHNWIEANKEASHV
ncbi:hypothetical protein CO683_14765 [Bradyrhizobium ottawaense]|uniref:hypothetical protein n=1 Tax=Bradyrhizobium ottawaense TaxID=931866 RepID=UPI000BE83780|nr:hypothetical protein [Bradyrhizobium ottawaense]PDT69223.1 hypothetical protein CO683_14765 [Bradyrhizobium ottawaense]